MAVQTKTLLNDVGSAVLAEAVSQLNRAAGYTSVRLGITLTAVLGDMGFVICKFTEDVLVTRVEFGFGDVVASLDNNADSIILAVGVNPDGSGGTPVGAITDFNPGDVATANLWTTLSALDTASASSILTGTDAPFQVDAGDALAIQFDLTGALVAGAQTIESVNVTYRPVKDALNLQPAFTPTMANFRSVTR